MSTLCDPVDHSLPGFSVHGILQARTGENCSGLPCPPPGGLPDLGIKHTLLSQLRNPVKGIGCHKLGFPDGSVVKNPPANAGDIGDAGSLLGSGRSPGEGNGNLLQYSCLENPMKRGAWWATVHGVAKSWT